MARHVICELLELSIDEVSELTNPTQFLGALTIVIGVACLFLLGTPSEVKWLKPGEKDMANTRILTNNTGYDRTGVKSWKWYQVWECLRDPCVEFSCVSDLLSLTY